jgi:hypothetical protein
MPPWARGVQFLWHNGAEAAPPEPATRSGEVGELVKPPISRSRPYPGRTRHGCHALPMAEDRGEIPSPHGGRTRRRDFTMVLLFAAATQSVQARERAAGPVADLRDTGPRAWPAFFGELRRLGDVEATTSPSSAIPSEGRPDRHGDVARKVAGRYPDVIVALSNPVVLAARSTASAPTPRLLRWPTKPPPSPFRPRGRVREGPLASASHGLVCNVRASRYAGARSCGKVTGIL